MSLVPTVLVDAYIVINGQNLSDHGNKAEFAVQAEGLDATTFGKTWKVRRGGLKDGTAAFSFLNDYQAGNIDEIMWPLVGTVPTLELRPTSGTVTSSNPKYTGSIFVAEWKPISGSVGQFAMADVTFPTSDAFVRGTS